MDQDLEGNKLATRFYYLHYMAFRDLSKRGNETDNGFLMESFDKSYPMESNKIVPSRRAKCPMSLRFAWQRRLRPPVPRGKTHKAKKTKPESSIFGHVFLAWGFQPQKRCEPMPFLSILSDIRLKPRATQTKLENQTLPTSADFF